MTPTPPQEIAEMLREHGGTLRRLGVRSLALFGSAARGDFGPENDVDVLYEFAPEAATLTRLLDLQAFLEELLDCDVDLVPECSVKLLRTGLSS